MKTHTLTEKTLFGTVNYEYFVSIKHDCRYIDLVSVYANFPDGGDMQITGRFFVDNGLNIPDVLRAKMIEKAGES